MVTARGNRHKPTQVSSTRFVVFDFAAQVGWALKQNTATVNAMRKITKKALVKKIKDGNAEVEAWSVSGQYADVRFYSAKGAVKRETVEVTGEWPEGWGDKA